MIQGVGVAIGVGLGLWVAEQLRDPISWTRLRVAELGDFVRQFDTEGQS